MRYTVVYLNLLGIPSETVSQRLGCPVLFSVSDLEKFLAAQQRDGRANCLLSVTDGNMDPDAVHWRTALNAAILKSNSLWVPCVFRDPTTIYVGPWIMGHSTPCLRCFSPQGL